MAGAPQKSQSLVSLIRLMTGTMWHERLGQMLQGLPIMREVNITPWLPEGWGGTADFVVWNPDLAAFVLVDLKTTKGESIRYVREGAKEEHVWQTSAYWHALRAMGLPLARVESVYYLPMNEIRGGGVEPVLVDFEPLPRESLADEMVERWWRTDNYVKSVDPEGPSNPGRYLTDALAAVQERRQVVRYDRKTGTHGLWLEPHWTAQFCPFEEELCDCSMQTKEQIGLFEGDEYYARPGYEDIEPEVTPGND